MQNNTTSSRFISLFEKPRTMSSIFEVMMNDSLEIPACQWFDDLGNIVSA